MDYLEGFFIGPVWSDTDYKSRRHLSSHIILSVLMLLLFVAFIFRPDLAERLVFVSYPTSLIFLIVLILLSPLLSSFYYRLPMAVRPLLLLLYLFKYILLFYLLLHFFMPLVPKQIDSMSAVVIERMDDHISAAIGLFEFAGNLFGMILGIVAGGLWIVLEMLLLIVAFLLIPLISLGLMKGIQFLLDIVYKRFIFQPVMDGKQRRRRTSGIRDSNVAKGDNTAEMNVSRTLYSSDKEDN